MQIRNGSFLNGDCLEILPTLPAGSVDMVLCDLPYGTTRNAWDSVVPLEPLWQEIWRLCSGAVVLTAPQPFTSALGASQLTALRYAWVWDKLNATGHLNAKRQPMKRHEDILIFSQFAPPYKPQGLEAYGKTTRRGGNGSNFGTSGIENEQEFTNYPRSILSFKPDGRRFHPTQKPVGLFEYLIRTYSEPGAVVLDMTAGSGTSAIAAERAGRRWICIERDETYYWSAVARLLGGND